MKRYLQSTSAALLVVALMAGCGKDNYSLGSVDGPTDVVISTTLQGQDGANPNGDGSGNVQIALSGKNALNYRIDYSAADGVSPVNLPGSTVVKKYSKVGLNTYTITVVAYGPGGSSTTVTKDVTVQSNFTLNPELESNIIGTGSKTWRVDKDVAGHFGVGPYNAGSVTPEWYAAAPREKAQCCNCFYTATYTFKKDSITGDYSLIVATPDGAFTKTGANAGGLPGIPASGDEGCYSYPGGTSSFEFAPASSGIAETSSTLTSITLGGVNTFIGYGAQLKEYEILKSTATTMYLRVQGTETGNAWYLKLIAL